VTPQRTTVTRIAGGVALLPLVFLTALCLVKYALWTTVAAGSPGLAGQSALLAHAKRMANLWVSCLATAEITAILILFLLLPARLRLFRLIVPVLAVPLVTGVIAYVLVVVGHPLH
jgi:hypothetical protein